jgi:hypothetical protein
LNAGNCVPTKPKEDVMNRSWNPMASTAALIAVTLLAVPTAGAVNCPNHSARRVAHFEQAARRVVTQCVRRLGDACPDTRLETRLERLASRIASALDRRCPDVGAADLIAAARARVLCDTLDRCSAGTITVRLESGDAGARTASARRLRADAGSSGLMHDLQILEGAEYTADLTDCDDPGDTSCTLHGATAGTGFGAPSPLSGGGIAFCVTVDFVSDISGTFDRATGELSKEADVEIGVFSGTGVDQPCPSCVPADGDPSLGEAGTCAGGAHAGAACVVEGLGDSGLGSLRGTSDACGAGTHRYVQFRTRASATTGAFDMAPLPDGPRCADFDFVGQTCPCGMCDDPGNTACRSHADCPAVGGVPGACGGRRCWGGSNDGQPCTSGSTCPGGICQSHGEPTAKNACVDQICTADTDGTGVCAAGPIDTHCAIAKHRGCLSDDDCPAGDGCVESLRPCHLDPIALAGTPDVPSAGRAQPTLVGGFCMASAQSASVNAAAGFPGPVTYVWPTEITLGE